VFEDPVLNVLPFSVLLLPLGGYRVRAELAGFKVVEQTGITLSAGQTISANVTLEVGGVQEVVQVTAESPVTHPGRIDLGRTITEAEIKNLPNVARNPYNFGLLQPNVTGYENEEFGATRMNANGSQMRTNYQIDGSSATQKDRAGLRMFQPSETMIKEVQVVSSGFAPEFGQTGEAFAEALPLAGKERLPDVKRLERRHVHMGGAARRAARRTRPRLGAQELIVDGVNGRQGFQLRFDRHGSSGRFSWFVLGGAR